MDIYNSMISKNDESKRCVVRPKRYIPRIDELFSSCENDNSRLSSTSAPTTNDNDKSISGKNPHQQKVDCDLNNASNHLTRNCATRKENSAVDGTRVNSITTEFKAMEIRDNRDQDLPVYAQGSVLDDELLAAKLQQVASEQDKLSAARFRHIDSRSSLTSSLNEDGEQNTFYVNENSPLVLNGSENSSVREIDTTISSPDVVIRGTFAGRRDILKCGSTFSNGECEIRSPKGTVRGFKNRVAAGIATFHFAAEQVAGNAQEVDYAAIEDGKIIIYSTNLTVNRKVHRDCHVVRSILHTHMVLYEERDLCMNKELQKELKSRLNGEIILPAVFVDGRFLGSAEKLEILNETGELRKIFTHFPCVSVRSACERCGGYRYVPCTICHGSKKSLHRNHFTETFHALRCTICNENGLIRCVVCHNQPR
ncbi:glutaredoxin domain-containing cysteine-rich protein CG12206-like [Tubulanus polymorphus]|uniref:glutaredoxin domain-containing cysteine-rich protein CG12206-like n=1 Tax=Tubulanus polymorphus TaxID=672921 RepID=UPI003DA6445C